MVFWLIPFLHTVLLLTTVHGYDPNSDPIQHLLQSNKDWASNTTAANSTFFPSLVNRKQSPKALWFGCSDSRVPESVITQSQPGDLFTHRNIANQIPPKGDDALAVLEYAVEHLHVENVIVVGHTKCGGAMASFAAAQSGHDPTRTIKELPASNPINKWLTPLTKLGLSLKYELSSKSDDEALQFLIEENVRRQVGNICKTKVIREAWEHEVEGEGKRVRVHGWIYDLESGILKDLNITRGPGDC